MEYLKYIRWKYTPSVLFGICIGISLSVYNSYDRCFPSNQYSNRNTRGSVYESTNSLESAIKKNWDAVDTEIGIIHSTASEIDQHNWSNNATILVNTTVADYLEQNVRVLCWILTHPDNHRSKAVHVKNTWGRRCDKLLIMSSEEDTELNTIKLNVTDEGHDYLWGKSKAAWKYVYKYHLNDADWFYKGDDDTFACMENMRAFLYLYSTQNPIYFGYKLKALVQQGYMSGGAGYVLSKTALIRLIRDAIDDSDKCEQSDVGSEDAEIGKCLESVQVLAGDTRDSLQRGRFFIHNPVYHLRQSTENNINLDDWYWKNMFYQNDEGLDCCSNTAISWHYVQSDAMYLLDVFHYSLRVYGRFLQPKELPKKLNFTAVALDLKKNIPQQIYYY